MPGDGEGGGWEEGGCGRRYGECVRASGPKVSGTARAKVRAQVRWDSVVLVMCGVAGAAREAC